jgi:predicted ATPase/DNA-binding SARP family transcriptional activator
VDDGVLLLGVPRRRDANGETALTAGRAAQLAAYLAIRADWLARDELVALLWPDAPPQRGRHTLSQLLYQIRRTPWGHDVEAEPTRVRWRVPSDVAAFRRAAAEGAWRDATELYGGELLEGVPADGSGRFDAWLRGEREDLRESWREAVQGHADALSRDRRWSDAARLLRRLLATDDLLEEAVQALMRCEARAGRREAAVQAYEAFRTRLHEELGLDPLEATVELAAAVRSGEVAPDAASPPTERRSARRDDPAWARDVRPGPVDNLTADATPFVGRALELAELHQVMGRGSHRLVTLLGPGGAGKSRVARQLARERAGYHEEGAAWVPLASARDASGAVAAVARALGVRIDPEPDALVALLAAQDRLLVLDAVEHVGDLGGLVLALLDGCPDLTLLTTSRVPLDLPGEAVVPLGGLAIPPHDEADDAEGYDALGLLLRAAHRVRPTFHPRGAERTAAVALTRLLGGTPLAIEMAAGWLRMLEPSELLEEVRRDLGVLTPQGGASDPRHASLQAVFESSWGLLGRDERDALRRLAVFRGGWTRETAADVAGVPLGTLLALANRSLLQRDGTARFRAHAIVQRFAEAKLAATPELREELMLRHERYFLDLADAADRRLDTPDQPAALARLEDEEPNLIAALERALAAGRVDAAQAMIAALGRSWRWRGQVREGLHWAERVAALPGSDTPSSTRVRARLVEGLLRQDQGDYPGADLAFEEALADAEHLGNLELQAAARCDRAIVAWRRGDLASARTLLEQAIAVYREGGHEARLAGTLGNLGNIVRDGGDPQAAHARFDEALVLAERLGHVWEMANLRNNKAIAYAYQDDLDAARREFETALALQRDIDNRPGISMSLTNLGNVHLDTGEHDRARELYGEALALCEELGDRQGAAHLFVNLGVLAQWSGEHDEAHDLYGRSLRIRRELGARALAVQSVSCFLDLAVARGAHERALVLAGAVRSLAERVGVPLTARQQHVYDEALAAARAQAPAARAAELERRGEQLGEREAISFALGERAGG